MSFPTPRPADPTAAARHATALPAALERVPSLLPPAGRRLAVFLDYDGTLAPIVRHPDLAQIPAATRTALQRLQQVSPVAILSGRDLADVRDRVAVAGIWYAGSHGFDMQGPAGEGRRVKEAEAFLPILEDAADRLEHGLAAIEGAWVERKRFALAVHHREAAADAGPAVHDVVKRVHAACPGLRIRGGKKVYELQPDLPWDKGAALLQVADALGLDLLKDHVLYIGDDETDEDAFRALTGPGAGILVREGADDARATWARYAVDSVDEVRRLLEALTAALERA